MIPRKAKDTIREFCELKGYNLEHIEWIINGYYEKINEIQKTLESDGLPLPGLGHMFIKVWTIKTRINKNTRYLKAGQAYNQWFFSDKIKDRLKQETEWLQKVYDRQTEDYYKVNTARPSWKRNGWTGSREQVRKEKLQKEQNNKEQNDTEGETTDSMGEQKQDS